MLVRTQRWSPAPRARATLLSEARRRSAPRRAPTKRRLDGASHVFAPTRSTWTSQQPRHDQPGFSAAQLVERAGASEEEIERMVALGILGPDLGTNRSSPAASRRSTLPRHARRQGFPWTGSAGPSTRVESPSP